MTGATDLTRDVDLDIAGLFAEIWRKKWLVIAITIVVAAGLFVSLSFTPPRYKASARVLIEKRESIFTRRNDGDLNLSSSQFDEQAIGSQVQVLTSDDLALKVIAKLDLPNVREFSGEAAPGLFETLLGMVSLGERRVAAAPEERLLEDFRKRLLVYAADKTRVLVVEFWAYDPDIAQKVPNALVDEYLEMAKQAKLEAESEATGWLGPEIEELRAKVKAAEAKAAEFRASSDILIGNNNALLATQQLSEASSELSRLRADKTAAEAKVSAIRTALAGGASLDTVPEVIASPLIQRLRERQVTLQGEISQLETTLLPNHPRLKALKSQLGDFDAQIRAAAANIMKSLEGNVVLARKQEAVLLDEIERLKAEAARVGEAEVGLRALEREANAQRELLETYLTRFREAVGRQQRDYQPVDARIISRAIRPAESYFPKVVPFTIAGATVAMVLSIVCILSWALLTGRALRPVHGAIRWAPAEPQFADAEPQPAGEPDEPDGPLPMVEAPAMQAEPQGEPLAATNQNREPTVPSFESFRPRDAIEAIRTMERAIVAVVSPQGNSRVAVGIARDLANGGAGVAVIDLSADGAAASELIGDAGQLGLADLANDRCRFGQAVFQDQQSTVQVMPAGDPERLGLALPLDRVRQIVAAMAESFDYLVLDCGDAEATSLSGLLPPSALVLVEADALASDDAAARVSDLEELGFRETIAIAA